MRWKVPSSHLLEGAIPCSESLVMQAMSATLIALNFPFTVSIVGSSRVFWYSTSTSYLRSKVAEQLGTLTVQASTTRYKKGITAWAKQKVFQKVRTIGP